MAPESAPQGVIRSVCNDLRFLRDLGMSANEKTMTEGAIDQAIDLFSVKAADPSGRALVSNLRSIRSSFTLWASFALADSAIADWNLEYIGKLQKPLSANIGSRKRFSPYIDSDDVKVLFAPFLHLAEEYPSTFYQLTKTLRQLGQISDFQPLKSYTAKSPLIARVVTATTTVLKLLKRDVDAVYALSPPLFEEFVCERLHAMGMNVRQVGHTYASDGGVDIIATPRESTFPFLLAVQVKHHRERSLKTSPEPVKDMQAVLHSLPFHAGMIVTNTEFTPDALWWASKSPGKIQLHDIQSIRNWINGRFDLNALQNIPRQIQLTPRATVDIW